MFAYRFCYTHARPLLHHNSSTLYIWLGESEVPEDLRQNTFSVREMFADLDFYRYYLYGGAATIAALRALRAIPNLDVNAKIIQSSYRKIVSFDPIGNIAKNFPSMCIAPIKDFHDFPVDKIHTEPFLLPKPMRLESYLQQYTQAHKLPDFLRYCAICCEHGVLSPIEVQQFMSCNLMIPGGCELGELPLSVWIDVMSKVETVTLEFCKTVQPVDVSSYQRRAVAFCNERLGSFLLLQHLASVYGNNIPANIFGYLINANTEEGDIYYRGT